ncbi:MAG TPA: TonB C-terminal domain-containing protein, partial [Polyangiaceae bacterium]|nr:TonB C-terminal domain-containing protein [Polyangiaceae bacterium]
MRSRDVTIPLGLWMCAAVCAHFLFGTGGLVVARMHDDRSELWKLSREASNLAQRDEQTFEVSLGEPSERQDEPQPPPPKPPEQPKPEPTVQKTPEKKTPEKPEKRLLVVEKKDEEKKPLVLPEDTLKDRRIAVVQHAKPDQQDNPEAKFIADQANHVEKETVATQTSHDRDDEHPTPGGNHPGSDPQMGDSERTRIAESEEHAGEKNRAPGERGTDFDVVHEPKLMKPSAATTATAPASQAPRPAPGDGRPVGTAQAPQPQAPAEPAPGGATAAAPDVESAAGGGWTFNPPRPGGAPGATPRPTPGGATQPVLPGGKLWSLSGLGQGAAPGSAMNTNINPGQIASIVGADNLRKLREADGERRKSEHRGTFVASNFDRWRSAIENYVSSVKWGNETALNTAMSPFASYLNGMHNRIHPIFADSFLDSLNSLPASHPLNDQHLVTRLEIILAKDGHLKQMGVVKTSGVTAFDIAALDSVDRAQPFGPAPSAIVSPDGNVYLHWEFHRDEVYACSTMGARPIILNAAPGPKNEEPQPPTPTPGPSKERG